MADCGSYKVTTYINKGKGEKERRKKEKKGKINYNELITEKLLLSDSFIEGKCPQG